MEEVSEETNSEDDKDENADDKDEDNTSEDEPLNYQTYRNTYMAAHQIQEKWEIAYPFAIYSAKQKGWLCKVCSEYGEGTEHWVSLAVKLFRSNQEFPFNH